MISSRFIKIIGAFEIPDDVEIGMDYSIALQGGITARTERPDEQGGVELEYRYRPLTGQIIAQNGASIPLKDKKSNSQKMRSMIINGWGLDYDRAMEILLANGDELRTIVEKTL